MASFQFVNPPTKKLLSACLSCYLAFPVFHGFTTGEAPNGILCHMVVQPLPSPKPASLQRALYWGLLTKSSRWKGNVARLVWLEHIHRDFDWLRHSAMHINGVARGRGGCYVASYVATKKWTAWPPQSPLRRRPCVRVIERGVN